MEHELQSAVLRMGNRIDSLGDEWTDQRDLPRRMRQDISELCRIRFEMPRMIRSQLLAVLQDTSDSSEPNSSSEDYGDQGIKDQ